MQREDIGKIYFYIYLHRTVFRYYINIYIGYISNDTTSYQFQDEYFSQSLSIICTLVTQNVHSRHPSQIFIFLLLYFLFSLSLYIPSIIICKYNMVNYHIILLSQCHISTMKNGMNEMCTYRRYVRLKQIREQYS